MTAWYDANGKRQVFNRYDSQDRVTAQTDAAGGRYRMEYARWPYRDDRRGGQHRHLLL